MKKALNRINQMDDRTLIILTVILFILSCVLRSVLGYFPKSTHVHPDEIRYLDISRSLFNGDGIIVHNVQMNYDALLYSVFLMPFNLISDQVLRVNLMSIGNSILVSTVIFPVFLLGKKLIRRNSVVLLLLLTVFFLPDMTMSATFMSESLFYPLAAWLIYFAFRFWDSETQKQKLLYCIACAFFCFLAFATKVVAVYFIAGFFAALGFDFFFNKSHTKRQNVLYGLCFGVVSAGCILLYKVLMVVLLGSGAATYSGNLRLGVYDFNTLIYYVYANLYNMMFALIAFFFFPVVMPVTRFKHLKKNEKNILVFGVVSLVAMIVIITTSISMNEDYPDWYMRQHTRYYAPLLILFLALFYREYFVPAEADEPNGPKTGWKLALFIVFFCMLIFSLLRFFSNVCIDGVLLQTIASLGEALAEPTGEINKFFVDWQLILVRCILAAIVISFSVLLMKDKTRKVGSRVFVMLIFAVSISNNVFAMKEFRDIYEDSPDTIGQAIAINDYVAENCGDSNVLIITKGYSPVLDMYINEYVYWTEKTKVLNLLEDQDYIDLSTQKIVSHYPFTEYEELDSVDYIITDNGISLDDSYYEEIDLSGVSRYSLYKAIDPAYIYLEPGTAEEEG